MACDKVLVLFDSQFFLWVFEGLGQLEGYDINGLRIGLDMRGCWF